MSNRTFIQVAALLLMPCITFLGYTYMSRTVSQVGPAPVVVEKPMVADLGDCYHALADIIRRDSEGLIGTTGHFYLAHIGALKLLVSETDYERVAGRDSEISKTIETAMGGLANKPITPELRVILADTLDGIGDIL